MKKATVLALSLAVLSILGFVALTADMNPAKASATEVVSVDCNGDFQPDLFSAGINCQVMPGSGCRCDYDGEPNFSQQCGLGDFDCD